MACQMVQWAKIASQIQAEHPVQQALPRMYMEDMDLRALYTIFRESRCVIKVSVGQRSTPKHHHCRITCISTSLSTIQQTHHIFKSWNAYVANINNFCKSYILSLFPLLENRLIDAYSQVHNNTLIKLKTIRYVSTLSLKSLH